MKVRMRVEMVVAVEVDVECAQGTTPEEVDELAEDLAVGLVEERGDSYSVEWLSTSEIISVSPDDEG